MPLVDGRLYLNSAGRRVQVGGPTAKHPELVYTYSGEWYRRDNGKSPRPDGRGPYVIDDWSMKRSEAVEALKAARQVFYDANNAEKVARYMRDEMRNFKIRIAMHQQRISLSMFDGIAMVASIIDDGLEATVGETIWDDCFPEYEAARKVYLTLKFDK